MSPHVLASGVLSGGEVCRIAAGCAFLLQSRSVFSVLVLGEQRLGFPDPGDPAEDSECRGLCTHHVFMVSSAAEFYGMEIVCHLIW